MNSSQDFKEGRTELQVTVCLCSSREGVGKGPKMRIQIDWFQRDYSNICVLHKEPLVLMR
jgi:hypothetical protein